MTVRTILAFVVAAGCGLTAVAVMNRGSNDQPPPQKVEIVSATRDLLNFDVVKPEFIGPREVHISDFQQGVHIPWPTSDNKSEEQVEQELKELYDLICDRTVVFSMANGDAVTDLKLASKEAGQGLAALIKPGMRAVSIDLTRAGSNVAGFVLPRNRVDIIAAEKSSSGAPKKSQTILEYVEVLAVNQRTHLTKEDTTDADPLTKSVTVLLSPEEVETLEFYKTNGSGPLTLSLRNAEDDPESNPRPIPKPVEVPVVEPEPPKPDPNAGLAARIPEGMRAVSIDISKPGSSVAGFILPKSHIDILSAEKPAPSSSTKSQTILENVEVLAVDQRTEVTSAEDEENVEATAQIKSVTVLLDPDDVETLEFYKNGPLTLTLRNPKDTKKKDPKPEETVVVKPPPKAEPQVPALPQQWKVFSQIRTLRAGQWGSVTIQEVMTRSGAASPRDGTDKSTTLAEFQADVMQASTQRPVVVMFGTDWSQESRRLAATLRKLADERGEQLKFVKINVDQSPEVVSRFDATQVPFVVAFAGGSPTDRFQGGLAEEPARAWIAQVVNSFTER